MQGHKDHKGGTTITTGSAKNASCALWFFVDIVTCGYKCRVTKITKEAQRPLREALNKRRVLCGLCGHCDCGYKCRVTKSTKESHRSLREALKMRRALCGSLWTL